MTLRELIEELEEAAEVLGDDLEVKAALQPSWPLTAGIDSIKALDGKVWVVLRESTDYADKRLWSEGVFNIDEELDDDDDDCEDHDD